MTGRRSAVVGVLLAGQPDDQVVQVGQQFVGRQVHVGEGVHGGTQPAHGGGGVDAVADDIADDEGDPGAGQRDHVEPVAADPVLRVGGQVARGHVDGGAAGQPLRQQAALQGQGRGALAGVAAGVVQAERGPGDQLLGEQQVVLLRTAPGPRCRTNTATPSTTPRAFTGMIIMEWIPVSRMSLARSGSWPSQVSTEDSSIGSKCDLPDSSTTANGDRGATKSGFTAGPQDAEPSGPDRCHPGTSEQRDAGSVRLQAFQACQGSSPSRTDSARSTVTKSASRGTATSASSCAVLITSRVLPMRALASLRTARRLRAQLLLMSMETEHTPSGRRPLRRGGRTARRRPGRPERRR